MRIIHLLASSNIGKESKTSPKSKRYRKPPSTFIEIKPSGISNYINIELEYPNGVKLGLADRSGIDLRSLINIV